MDFRIGFLEYPIVRLLRMPGQSMYQVSQFDNGLRVATAEMPSMLSVSVGLWVGTGSRYEPAPLNGVCHFIEHLLFKGTKHRSAREISQAVEGIGGYLNAFTSEEATCFHARASYEHFEELLEVLMDMLLNSRFAPVEIAKEREVIKEEIAMYLDEPQHYVQELLNTTLWPGQPLGRPITGTERSLDGLSRSRITAYLREHYIASNLVVVVSGRVSHHKALRAVRHYISQLPCGTASQRVPVCERQKLPQFRLVTRKTEQTQIALGIRTCSRHDPRRYALRLLNAVLGENMSSRLFQLIREELGLAYSIYSSPSLFEDTGDLVVAAGLDADNLGKTLKLIVRELQRLAKSPPPLSELQRARDYVLGQLDLGSESTETQMNWLGEQLLGYGRFFRPADVKRHLSRVTASDICSVARAFFRPERLNLAMVSSLEKSRSLAKMIEHALAG